MSRDTDGWIGVDLDGTLASNVKHGDAIGEPIPAMVDRVKLWLSEGQDVRLFTARAYEMEARQLHALNAWMREHLGEELPITCEKDPDLREIWDDRAIQIITNTGQRADGEA